MNIICVAVLSVDICVNYGIKPASKHQADKVIHKQLVKRRAFVFWFFNNTVQSA